MRKYVQAKNTDYGIIPKKQTKPKYLHEFRNEIAGYDDELAKLHKQQYHTMVYEQDGKKLDELAERQAQLEKEKAVLKDRYYSAMGIGSEGKSGSENMLIGEGNNPNFSYDDLYSVYGIDKDNMLPNKGLNLDKGSKTITFNGKTYEVAPDGKLREVLNTKPLGTMEDIRLYPKGQSPFDVGYFEGKGINPQPYIIDPNEKPKDKRQYLMAGNAFFGARVKDENTTIDEFSDEPSPMPGPPPVPKGHPDMNAYEKELEDGQKEQEELTGGFAGGGGGRGGGGGSWPKDAKERIGLQSLANSMNDSEAKSILENVLENSEKVNSEMIHVDYEAQKDFKKMTDDWEKHAQDIYDAYVSMGSSAAGALLGVAGQSKAGGVTKKLLSALGALFGDSPEAPIIKEGNYVMYTTNYYEQYDIYGMSTRKNNVLILAEVDENGKLNEPNHLYTFNQTIDTPYDWEKGPELPTFNNSYFESGGE